ncbi:MAG: hypothetical protein V7K97_03400 [Nostoc sp.]|uniref:hypothetical protein n=1 Tax=Nostoc sp. TaxID=1180 RepID=UPI002FF55548
MQEFAKVTSGFAKVTSGFAKVTSGFAKATSGFAKAASGFAKAASGLVFVCCDRLDLPLRNLAPLRYSSNPKLQFVVLLHHIVVRFERSLHHR